MLANAANPRWEHEAKSSKVEPSLLHVDNKEKQWLGVESGLCNYNLKKPKNMYKHALPQFWFKLCIQESFD